VINTTREAPIVGLDEIAKMYFFQIQALKRILPLVFIQKTLTVLR